MNSPRLALYAADQCRKLTNQQIARYLQPDELEVLQRGDSKIVQHERAFARAATRHLLAGTAGGEPLEWRFRPQESGKPEAVRDDGLRVNISWAHSRGSVLTVVSNGPAVGCDLEQWERAMPENSRLARFSADFLDAPICFPSNPALHLWVAREAVAKLRGRSIFRDFSDVRLKEVRQVSGQTWEVHFNYRGGVETHACALGRCGAWVLAVAVSDDVRQSMNSLDSLELGQLS